MRSYITHLKSKRNIFPSTKNKVATIRLTKKQEEMVKRFIPEVFLKREKYPEDLHLIISEDEEVLEEFRRYISNNVLEIKNIEVEVHETSRKREPHLPKKFIRE